MSVSESVSLSVSESLSLSESLSESVSESESLSESVSESLSENVSESKSVSESLKGGRTPNKMRSAASRHVFKIQTHCFLWVYAHLRRHSVSVRSAQQRLRMLFKFLPCHRAPSALFYIK